MVDALLAILYSVNRNTNSSSNYIQNITENRKTQQKKKGNQNMQKETANNRLRQAAAKKNVPLWMVAQKFGITDSHFSRWLRVEFDRDRMKQALQYVDEIANSMTDGGASGSR